MSEIKKYSLELGDQTLKIEIGKSTVQILGIILGVCVMLSLLLLE